MKKAIIIALLFLTAFAEPSARREPRRLPAPPGSAPSGSIFFRDPFREVNGIRCDLRAKQSWWASGYRGADPSPAWVILNCESISSSDRGILASQPGGAVLFIKNYPARRVVDRTELTVIVTPAGTQDYLDAQGGQHTCPAYDYGIPFTPERAPATNQVQITTTATNNVAVRQHHSTRVDKTNSPPETWDADEYYKTYKPKGFAK